EPALGRRMGVALAREADRLWMTRYVPPSVFVNEQLDIVQFRGNTSPYLTPAPGRASLNVTRMLREGLAAPVSGALLRAQRAKELVRETGLRVRSEDGWRNIDVLVMPLGAEEEGPAGFLILFAEPSGHLV